MENIHGNVHMRHALNSNRPIYNKFQPVQSVRRTNIYLLLTVAPIGLPLIIAPKIDYRPRE